MSYVKVKERPDNTDMEGDHYYCTLKKNKNTYAFYYTKGYGFKGEPPTISEILETFIEDTGPVGYKDFEEWANEYGYDTDSLKALRIYKAIKRQNAHVSRVLGEDLLKELEEIYMKRE